LLQINKQFIVVLGALVVGMVAWLVIFFLPLQKNISQLNEKIRMYEGKMETKISDQEIASMMAEVDSLNVKLEEKRDKIYPLSGFLDLGGDLKAIGSEHGLKLEAIRPDYTKLSEVGKTESDISELILTAEYSGTFKELTQFLDSKDKFPFWFGFHEIMITKKESGTDIDIGLKGKIILSGDSAFVKTPVIQQNQSGV
jgi:hypothetical protein